MTDASPVRYLSGLPLDEVVSGLSHLPRNSIVYSPGIQEDGQEHTRESGCGAAYVGRVFCAGLQLLYRHLEPHLQPKSCTAQR